MVTEKQIEICKALLSTGIIDSAYHSVTILTDGKKGRFAVYSTGGEQYYIAPDDKKGMFAYVRVNGEVAGIGTEMISSCSKVQVLRVPMRIVVFNVREKRNHDALTRKLLSVSLARGITLNSYSTDAFLNAKNEAPAGKFAFDAFTYYLAIDINVSVKISETDCQPDLCIDFNNPVCL